MHACMHAKSKKVKERLTDILVHSLSTSSSLQRLTKYTHSAHSCLQNTMHRTHTSLASMKSSTQAMRSLCSHLPRLPSSHPALALNKAL